MSAKAEDLGGITLRHSFIGQFSFPKQSKMKKPRRALTRIALRKLLAPILQAQLWIVSAVSRHKTEIGIVLKDSRLVSHNFWRSLVRCLHYHEGSDSLETVSDRLSELKIPQ